MVAEFTWKDNDFYFTVGGKKYIIKNAQEYEVDNLLHKGILGRAIHADAGLNEDSFVAKNNQFSPSGLSYGWWETYR